MQQNNKNDCNYFKLTLCQFYFKFHSNITITFVNSWYANSVSAFEGEYSL